MSRGMRGEDARSTRPSHRVEDQLPTSPEPGTRARTQIVRALSEQGMMNQVSEAAE